MPITHQTKKTRRTAPKRSAGIRNEVEIDEARERVGAELEAFHLQSSEGVDALAEQLGEEFVENVTGADDAASEHRDAMTVEENGGPFVPSRGAIEFADGIDGSNPRDATREPLPKTGPSTSVQRPQR